MISALLVFTVLSAEPGVISEVRRSFLEDGAELVSATSTHRVLSHADGSLELQGVQPLRLTLQSVTRGTSCATSVVSRLTLLDSPNTVRTFRGCDVEESWTNGPSGLEHAFTLLRAPAGSGPITLFVRVDGPWHHADENGHVFKGPGASHSLRYGRAFVVRGARRTEIEVAHVEGGLELRVPASIADAPQAFPMEIDPVLSAEVELDPTMMDSPSPGQDETPAIAVNSAGRTMIVWADNRRGLGADLWGARIESTGTLMDTRGLPLNIALGHQVRPALAATGPDFLLAWDTALVDGGNQIRARPVSAAGLPGAEFPVVNGSQAALAQAGDSGVLFLAYVDPASNAQVLPILGTMVGSPVSRPVIADERAARPAIAASNHSWFAAWEVTSVTAPVASIRGMRNGGTVPNIVPIFTNIGVNPARNPTVALMAISANDDDAFVFWDEGAFTNGSHVSDLSQPLPYSFTGSSAALVRTSAAIGVKPTLGSFVSGRLQLRDLNDGGTTSLGVGTMPSDLVLAGPQRLAAAWTESPRNESDIYGAMVINATTAAQRVLISGAPSSQRSARVAIVDGTNEGIAVWMDGTTTIFGAKVIEDVNGLRLGSRFLIASTTQTLQQVEVAAVSGSGTQGPETFLVAWRQAGLPGVMGQLISTSSTIDPPFTLSTALVSAGPAVAWDEGAQAFQVAFSQGGEMVTRSVKTDGTLGALTTRLTSQATELAIGCLRGTCLLAWQKAASRELTAVMFGGIAPAPWVRTAPAGSPAIAHDGTDFYLAWHSANGIALAKFDSATGNASDVGNGIPTTGSAALTSLSLASATPPVLVWSELTSDEVTLFMQRADLQGPVETIAPGFNAAVAVGSVSANPSGIVVYQRFLTGVNAMRVFGRAFSYAPDAGYRDGGLDAGFDAGVDAGAPDAGTSDAGDDAGADAGVDAGPVTQPDAGTEPGPAPDGGVFVFETSGCGCQTGSGAPPLGLLLMLALRRRQGSARRS